MKAIDNADLERMVDTSDEWITTRTGIRERRVAGEDEYMSTFATRAAEEALESAGMKGSDLDIIICATVTPDMPDDGGARRSGASAGRSTTPNTAASLSSA